MLSKWRSVEIGIQAHIQRVPIFRVYGTLVLSEALVCSLSNYGYEMVCGVHTVDYGCMFVSSLLALRGGEPITRGDSLISAKIVCPF